MFSLREKVSDMEIIGILLVVAVALGGWAGTGFDRVWLPLVIVIILAAVLIGFFVYGNFIDKLWHIRASNRKTFKGKGYSRTVDEVIESNEHHDH
ncbi:hypothetical protein EON76_00620 [bacterium]|nr:MAG: hypothetical protein EON76_00620 [bacterium]